MSRAPSVSTELLLVLWIMLIAAMTYNPLRNRYRYRKLLKVGRPSAWSPGRLGVLLYRFNKDSAHATFTADKHFDLSINGHVLTVVKGTMQTSTVNPKGFGWYSHAGVLFAVAAKPDSEWFKEHVKALALYKEGKRISVFWIKNPQRLYRACDIGTDATERVPPV
jgi:hypothetical protein